LTSKVVRVSRGRVTVVDNDGNTRTVDPADLAVRNRVTGKGHEFNREQATPTPTPSVGSGKWGDNKLPQVGDTFIYKGATYRVRIARPDAPGMAPWDRPKGGAHIIAVDIDTDRTERFDPVELNLHKIEVIPQRYNGYSGFLANTRQEGNKWQGKHYDKETGALVGVYDYDRYDRRDEGKYLLKDESGAVVGRYHRADERDRAMVTRANRVGK
jgi:hypothetical protein